MAHISQPRPDAGVGFQANLFSCLLFTLKQETGLETEDEGDRRRGHLSTAARDAESWESRRARATETTVRPFPSEEGTTAQGFNPLQLLQRA